MACALFGGGDARSCLNLTQAAYELRVAEIENAEARRAGDRSGGNVTACAKGGVSASITVSGTKFFTDPT